MLIEKYLSAYDFNEFHSIKVNAGNGIYEKMLHCDVGRSFLVRLLFTLRGMPTPLYSIDDLKSIGFVKLDEEPGREILYGIITDSPVFNSCHSNVSPESFLQNTNTGIVKAAINFYILEENSVTRLITTETRIWCGSKQVRAKFKLYWFFVKPFSQLIRRSMLKQMKQQILKSAKEPISKV